MHKGLHLCTYFLRPSYSDLHTFAQREIVKIYGCTIDKLLKDPARYFIFERIRLLIKILLEWKEVTMKQLRAKQTTPLVNKHYENEVALRQQNWS